jgi:hypothetical protein
VLPSICPDHQARTLVMAAKASSGVLFTVKAMVRFSVLMMSSGF